MKGFGKFSGDVEWLLSGEVESPSSEDGEDEGFVKHETSIPPLVRARHFPDSSRELDDCTHRG